MWPSQLAKMSTAVQKYVSETTTHGPLHLTGERRVYIKAVWLVAFLASIGYCSVKVYAAYQKFVSRDVTTTIKANQLDFEFPDVYFCNEKPISGSYSVTLSDEDSKLLSRYRKLVNESTDKIKLERDSHMIEMYASLLINTLPFQFLSDKMANQIDQSIIRSIFEGRFLLNITTFHHPSLINCFKLQLSDYEISTLQNPSSYIELHVLLFSDPKLPKPFDNSTEQDIIRVLANHIDLKPNDWNFNFGVDYGITPGFHVLFVPKGQYPSDLDLSLSLGTGFYHQVKIRMQDVVYNEKDLADKCDANSDGTVDFVNPYSGDKQAFKYSQAACWYREVSRLSMENLNCSIWRLPVPWEYRLMPSCRNLTQFKSNATPARFVPYSVRYELLRNASMACAKKVPCRHRIYSCRHSLKTWPNSEEDWHKYYRSGAGARFKNGFSPGIHYMLNNASFQQKRESLVQLSLSAEEYQSTEVQLSLAYDFNSLIADVGGLLGLFLGMSLLSVLELVELLHDCILAVWQRKIRGIENST